MAAPHIPNLSTLRPSGRGRGRGLPGNPSSSTTTTPSADEDKSAAKARIVQLTDQDASISRWSAVEAGYLNDPFARLFTPTQAQRRFPIINRGTYIRTTAIDNLIQLFLSQSPTITKQIISLGAGSDTRFFRLSSPSPLIYHELDFAANTSSKISTISHSSILLQRIPAPITILPAGDTLHSPQYYIHPYDLRTLDSSRQSSLLPHIDPLLPTLLISECCLCYLTPVTADSVVAFFAHLFPARTPLGMLLYEPINPFDGFGRVMVSNLAARGIELHTLERYGSLEAQRERLRKYGFSDGVRAMDVDALWEQRVTAEEKQRVGGLEMVDEVEEWRLLAQHYCVAWGWRDKERNGEGADEEERGRAAEEGEKGKELQNTKADEAESKNNHDNDNDDVWKKWRTET